MKGTPLSDYYWLGMCVNYLLGAGDNYPVHGEGGILENVDLFLSSVRTFGLVVTAQVATAQGLVELRNHLCGLDPQATLSQHRAEQLRGLMETVCITLEAEIEGFESYVVSPKRIDVTMLMENVPELFAPGVFDQLPESARHDFAEAGKCIAFERPTAAAFHLWRGTETVLRHFYCSLVSQKRVSLLAWKPMVCDLRKRPKTKRHEMLYTNLDSIRAAFSDPAQHPETTYDVHTVQDLWLACVKAVNQMVKALEQ
jgi:hypothetical protein